MSEQPYFYVIDVVAVKAARRGMKAARPIVACASDEAYITRLATTMNEDMRTPRFYHLTGAEWQAVKLQAGLN